MNWSWKIGRLAGIDIFMHWTFLLLLGYFGLRGFGAHNDPLEALAGVGLVLAVFVCIVLHELGHALMARRYNIQTRDITLLPIGGVARLERMPDDPRQELWIALAGPAVNVVIAVVLAAVLVVLGAVPALPSSITDATFLPTLLAINLTLIVFNMLPAFPMDGGRVLRALLAHWISYGLATTIAARVGQAMALLFAVVGIFGLGSFIEPQPMMLLIGMFVFFGAAAEERNVRARVLLTGVPVREAMDRAPVTVPPDARLIQVADYLMIGQQRDFPVVTSDRLIGMLRREQIVQAISHGQANSFVGDILTGNCEAVDEGEMLDRALQQMGKRGITSLPVTQEERFVGLLTPESVGQYIKRRTTPQVAPVVEQPAIE